MIGGRGKFAGRFALVAAAGMLAGSMGAQAADLGGDCCADLEERVAELEATTVRKGQRKVSLTLSGFVGHTIMYWDDGKVSDVYIGDGGNYYSRFRFVGTARINAEVTAGFLYEFGISNNQIGAMNQIQGRQGDNGDDNGSLVSLRDSTVWLEHKRLGRVKLGQGSTATDNLILINLGNPGGAATPDVALYMGGFRVRDGRGNFSDTTWQALIRGHESWDTSRRNHVMYQTPTLAGFNIQTAVAEDNYWDVALRYAGEFGGFRLAFGIGYQEDTEFNNQRTGVKFGCADACTLKAAELKGSASIMHVPSGLFLTGAAGNREWSGQQLPGVNDNSKDTSFWYLTGGIAQNWTGLGNTVLFGEYGEYDNGTSNYVISGFQAPRPSTTVTMWGVGVTQHISAAAMEVFATYKNFDLDIQRGFALTGFTQGPPSAGVVMGAPKDLSIFMVGARMNF
jgi:hypothetical protein